MNCFFVLPNLDAGGAERVSITIARVLKRNGHSVSFINMGIESGDMLPWIVPEFQLVSFGNKRVISAIPQLHKFIPTTFFVLMN